MIHARVAVPVPLGQAFSYAIPPDLRADVVRGARVICEFGRQRVLGVVIAIEDGEPDVPAEKLKPIRAVVGDEPVVAEELLSFLLELARYYVAPIGEVMRLALPALERSAAEALAQQGLLEKVKVKRAGGRLVQRAALVDGASTEGMRGRARDVVQHLAENGPTLVTELSAAVGDARAAVKKLSENGVVALERVESTWDPFFSPTTERDTPPDLTAPQLEAVTSVINRLSSGGHGAFLLHGVTASGKTEVYLRAVQHCLESGGAALVLVPEIALTPQLVGRFRARLGDEIAVLHSGLSDRERHRMWRRLRSGELKVAVGARSALFAPVERLRLICVDEEHDHSFKQEEGVRYNARDMAIYRAHRAGAVCVLGSATPSVEVEWLARQKKIDKLVLPDRARSTAVLPEVEIVDLRRVGPAPIGEKLISLHLFRALENALAKKEQAILFLNRRGFAPSVICEDCGALAECRSCSVALTYHRGTNSLRCHYCDYSAPMTGRCTECKSDRIEQEGAGTERIERALASAFPNARVARLDRDVAAGLKSEKILDRMRSGEIDILVGTQMVTKGHDLPSVTLVGVLNADAALSMPDFRASERTFHLLVQVAGRAGRGTSPGTVMIQTRQPEHAAIAYASQHDVNSFLERELMDRKELRYPPFAHVALTRIEGTDENVTWKEAERLTKLARDASTKGVEIIGPAPAPIVKIKNRWRHRFMVRATARPALRTALLAVVRAPTDRRVRVTVDVDPVSML